MTGIKPDHLIIQKVKKWEEGWDFMDLFSEIGVGVEDDGLEQAEDNFVAFLKHR